MGCGRSGYPLQDIQPEVQDTALRGAMMTAPYFGYLALIVGVFLFWCVGFAVMRRRKDKEWGNLTGFLLAGPLHFYLRERRYSLSRREMVGWGIVFVVMALAPIATKLLE